MVSRQVPAWRKWVSTGFMILMWLQKCRGRLKMSCQLYLCTILLDQTSETSTLFSFQVLFARAKSVMTGMLSLRFVDLLIVLCARISVIRVVSGIPLGGLLNMFSLMLIPKVLNAQVPLAFSVILSCMPLEEIARRIPHLLNEFHFFIDFIAI